MELKSLSSSVPEEQKESRREREEDEQRRAMNATVDESLNPEEPDLRLDIHRVSYDQHTHSHRVSCVGEHVCTSYRCRCQILIVRNGIITIIAQRERERVE